LFDEDNYFAINEVAENSEESYNAEFMEEDGNYDDFLNGLTFNFQEMEEELTPPVNMYDGRGPSLQRGVARQFESILECVSICGGMDYDFFKQVTANSNSYARMHMTHSGKFGGSPWSNISVQEMIQFHGMVLKMSVDHRELGGYETDTRCIPSRNWYINNW